MDTIQRLAYCIPRDTISSNNGIPPSGVLLIKKLKFLMFCSQMEVKRLGIMWGYFPITTYVDVSSTSNTSRNSYRCHNIVLRLLILFVCIFVYMSGFCWLQERTFFLLSFVIFTCQLSLSTSSVNQHVKLNLSTPI